MEMLVPKEFQISEEEVQWLDFGNTVTWRELLMVDYVYHHKDADYDGGMSFVDRLFKKLSNVRRQWGSLANIKRLITNGSSFEEKKDRYLWTIRLLLSNQSDVDCYGL
jgi:hypothetical protein